MPGRQIGIWALASTLLLALMSCETQQGLNDQHKIDSLENALMAEKRLSYWSKNYIETVCLPKVAVPISTERLARYLRDSALIVSGDPRLPQIAIEPLRQPVFRVATDIHFLPGESTLEDNMIALLLPLGDSLADKRLVQLTIEGHTDDRELRKGDQDATADAYWDLSLKRARFVADLFIKRGVFAAQIKIGGGSRYYGLASNQTELGRRENRRVEIYVSTNP